MVSMGLGVSIDRVAQRTISRNSLHIQCAEIMTVRSKILCLAMLVFSYFAHAQLGNLDAYMQGQIESGWWTVEEREIVLQYLERTGLPGVKEEAFSIEGLSERTAQELMLCDAWLRLVAQAKQLNSSSKIRFDCSAGRSPIRSAYPSDELPADPVSFRLRNTGKWGLRFDRRQSMVPSEHVSGFMQAQVGSNWRFLIGGHRLGWGHRLTVEETSLFSGLDDPVFVLPITYDFTPAWGHSDYVPRNGFATAFERLNWKGAVSIQGSGNDVAWMLGRNRPGWGVVGHVQGENWRVGAFSPWSHSTWQGLVECTVAPGEASAISSWQSTPSRKAETHGRLVFRHSSIAGGSNWEWSWGGQQWSENGQWRLRWRMEWNDQKNVIPVAVQLRKRIAREAFWEIRAEASQFRALQAGPELRRFDFRYQFELDGMAVQMRCFPRVNRHHPGGMSVRLDKTVSNSKFKLLWVVWDMDEYVVGYFPDLSHSGLQFRPMRGSGFRFSAAWRWRPSKRLRLELIYSQSNRRDIVATAPDMLTSGYAQTGISAALQVRL